MELAKAAHIEFDPLYVRRFSVPGQAAPASGGQFAWWGLLMYLGAYSPISS